MNKEYYNEVYRKIYRLKELIQEYRQAEYHNKHENVLYMKREYIKALCDKIKHEFE
jgi:hypothetical protein